MSRERLLQNIQKNRPPAEALPAADVTRFGGSADAQKGFVDCVESVGGRVVFGARSGDVRELIRSQFPGAKKILSLVEGTREGSIDSGSSAKELDDLDVAILEGAFGVAENGAVWLPESDLGHRSLPFIASHVVIVLRREDIVGTMHDAMLRIAGFTEGYGVFVSGPSKTADIEQSLVIGAQGPLSLTIFLVAK